MSKVRRCQQYPGGLKAWEEALCREQVGEEGDCSCCVSLGRAGGGVGSQDTHSDRRAGLALGHCQTGQAAGKGKQEK